MAKKRNPFVGQPTASCNDDEVPISESADEEDSSSDEEPTKSPIKIPSTAVTKAASGKSTVVSAGKQCSDSDSGSETETDSEAGGTNPPKSESGKTVLGKPSKKDSTFSVASPVAKSGTKRPASEGPSLKENTSTKRPKEVTSGKEESMKNPAFQRLWTEEDEVSLLQGMIDYADTGKSPLEEKNAFYELLKKSISFEVTKNQFIEKIRSLRKKFMGKKWKNGAEPKGSNAHDQKMYNLSKHIWGPDGISLELRIKSIGISRKSQRIQSKKKELENVKQDLEFENSFLVRSIAGFGIDERIVKEKWSLVQVEEKKKIEERLKHLQANEFEFVLRKIGLVHDVTSMLAEASKSNP